MASATPAPSPPARPIDAEAIASDCYATVARATAEHIAHIFDVAVEEGHPFSERHTADVIYAAQLVAKNLHAEFEGHVVRTLEIHAEVDDELRRRREESGDA